MYRQLVAPIWHVRFASFMNKFPNPSLEQTNRLIDMQKVKHIDRSIELFRIIINKYSVNFIYHLTRPRLLIRFISPK